MNWTPCLGRFPRVWMCELILYRAYHALFCEHLKTLEMMNMQPLTQNDCHKMILKHLQKKLVMCGEKCELL